MSSGLMQDEGQQYRRSTWRCPSPRDQGFDAAANVKDLLSELTQANVAPNKAGAAQNCRGMLGLLIILM